LSSFSSYTYTLYHFLAQFSWSYWIRIYNINDDVIISIAQSWKNTSQKNRRHWRCVQQLTPK
jgi:hypothetical protein